MTRTQARAARETLLLFVDNASKKTPTLHLTGPEWCERSGCREHYGHEPVSTLDPQMVRMMVRESRLEPVPGDPTRLRPVLARGLPQQG